MSEDKRTVHERFFAAYADMSNPAKNARNDHFKNAYATLEQVLESSVKPALETHGLILVQEVASDEHGVGVRTYVETATGERKDFGTFTLPLAKRDPQGGGSAITYARRYALKAIFGLSEVDDDGNGGSEHEAKKAAEREAARVLEADKAAYKSLLAESEANGHKAALGKAMGDPSSQAAAFAIFQAAPAETRAAWRVVAQTGAQVAP